MSIRQYAATCLSAGSVLAALAMAISVAVAQEPRDSQFKAATTAITVDVVVRDQRGRPVTDLRRSDFQLLENGIAQHIGDVTLVAPPSQAAAGAAGANPPDGTEAASATAQPKASPVAPSFVALVFDRLSPEGRGMAHKSALTYLESNREHDFAGVFLSDLSLVTIQTFTTDRARVRKAIDEVATRATGKFDRMRIGMPGLGDPEAPPTPSPESEGPPFETVPGQTSTSNARVVINLATMASRMERAFEAMARDQQGHATINSLLAVVTGLGQLPGRKSVIFFAEALAIPPNVQPQFESVVATANRFNVTLYSIDAAGLRVHSGQSETARRVNAIAAEGMSRDPDGPGKFTETLELNEDVLRRDPAVSLRLLADRTGGFLIDSTNDLAGAFRRIDEDRRFHYLLTYTPKNPDFHGEWRRIAVTVPERNVTVQARSGYLAVRTPGALPLLHYEGPALAALDRTPLPTELPVRAGAFVFPESGRGESRVVVLVATDGGALAGDADQAKGTARTDFTILARLKDKTGEVVRKGSQPYRLAAPAANLRGDVLFFRQPTVPPGTYTLEYVIHDAMTSRASAGTMPVVVPKPLKNQPRVSSLVIVRRTERVPAGERDVTNPLYYGDLLFYPNLGEPISKREGPALSFAFSVIPGPAPARASLTLSQGERTVGEVPLMLGTPGADGRIQYVSQLPLASLPAGGYTLSVTVTAPGFSETRRVRFQIVE